VNGISSFLIKFSSYLIGVGVSEESIGYWDFNTLSLDPYNACNAIFILSPLLPEKKLPSYIPAPPGPPPPTAEIITF
jgi:hypothetical protein